MLSILKVGEECGNLAGILATIGAKAVSIVIDMHHVEARSPCLSQTGLWLVMKIKQQTSWTCCTAWILCSTTASFSVMKVLTALALSDPGGK